MVNPPATASCSVAPFSHFTNSFRRPCIADIDPHHVGGVVAAGDKKIVVVVDVVFDLGVVRVKEGVAELERQNRLFDVHVVAQVDEVHGGGGTQLLVNVQVD